MGWDGVEWGGVWGSSDGCDLFSLHERASCTIDRVYNSFDWVGGNREDFRFLGICGRRD